MATPDYYATYCRFFTRNKDEAGLLMGADCCVGDVLDIQIDERASDSEGQLVNRFGATIGHLNADIVEQVRLARAKGWHTQALLASVYFTEPTDKTAGPGYWGEVVIMCFADTPAFRAFSNTIAHALGEGLRPTVELGSSGVEKILDSAGEWLPDGRVPKPDIAHGTAVVKDHLSFNEKMVEQARQRNPGCMAAGWLFIIVLIAAVVWLVIKLLPM